MEAARREAVFCLPTGPVGVGVHYVPNVIPSEGAVKRSAAKSKDLRFPMPSFSRTLRAPSPSATLGVGSREDLHGRLTRG